MCGICIDVQGTHVEMVSVEDGKKSSKQACMVDRERLALSGDDGLVLDDGAEHLASLSDVYGARIFPLMEQEELMNGQRCIDFWMDCAKCIHRLLHRLYILDDAFGCDV